MSLSKKQVAILKQIEEITINPAGILTVEKIEESIKLFTKDIRPGRGLIGTKEEEETFGARSMSITLYILSISCIIPWILINRYLFLETPNAELRTEQPSSQVGHNGGEPDEDAFSDIDNVEQGHRPYKPNKPPSSVESDEEETAELDEKYVLVNGIVFGLWDYLGFGYMDHIVSLAC